MCTDGGFSASTVQRAVREFATYGRLSVSQRAGIRLSETPSEHPARHAPAHRWEQVHDAIRDDIVAGRYPAGTPLPMIKELCAWYGAGFLPVKTALERLAAERRIIAGPRRYLVYQALPRTSQATLLVITPTESREALTAGTPQSAELWRTLERECYNRSLKLSMASANELMLQPDTQIRRLKKQAVVGVIVFSLGLYQDRRELFGLISRLKKPVAVLEEMAGASSLMPRILYTDPLLRHYRLSAGPSAGATVGRYLFSLGHRRVGFITLVDKDEWYLGRLAGCRAAFTTAGLADAVTAFSLGTYSNYDEIYREMLALPACRKLSAHLQAVEHELDPESRSEYRLLMSDMINPMRRKYIRSIMRPLLKKALEHREITAWVAVHDLLGLIALEFLGEQKVAVPRTLSVLAFDDTVEAFVAGLTSYNFNAAALIADMLLFILGSPAGGRRNSPKPVELEGMVMARASTAPADP